MPGFYVEQYGVPGIARWVTHPRKEDHGQQRQAEGGA